MIANHDVAARDSKGHPVADFDRSPDSLGYFTNFHLPLNGPEPEQAVPISGNPKILEDFRSCAAERFPTMANYSFDYGDVHFLCLDSNVYVDPTSPRLQAAGSKTTLFAAQTNASWKFVVHHHPGFNVGLEHYSEQHMRAFSPLFEKHGVNFVLSGHEHNYQRSLPLRFAPNGPGMAKLINSRERLVPGTFTIDRGFDGQGKTHADGVIYIVTGAGGKHLYDASLSNVPSAWLHPEDGNADYVGRFTSDRHSLTIFEVDEGNVWLRQVDEFGQDIERIHVTKA